MRTVTLNGLDFPIVGNDRDPYFANIHAFAADNNELNATLKTLPADAVCFDVGANIGITAILAATARPAGQVFAFEPSPATHAYLTANTKSLPNVRAIHSAVGAASGVIRFNLPEQAANSTVARAALPKTGETADVPQISLDDFARNDEINRLDFIKIDVEGYEPEVLAGAADTITRLRPVILMEFNALTLMIEARLSPWVFLESLHALFHLSDVRSEPRALEDAADLYHWLIANLTKHGLIDDLAMRVRDGVTPGQIRAAMAGTSAAADFRQAAI